MMSNHNLKIKDSKLKKNKEKLRDLANKRIEMKRNSISGRKGAKELTFPKRKKEFREQRKGIR